MVDIDMLMKFAPASVATAFASIVFPVPGGPKSNIPLQAEKGELANKNNISTSWPMKRRVLLNFSYDL